MSEPGSLAIDDVSGFTVQDFGSYVLLRWSWPVRCSQVTLAWRGDEFPAAPGERRTTCRRVTRAEYDRLGGVQLEQLAASPYYFVVFAVGQRDGQESLATGASAGARCFLRRRTGVEVLYRIKRQWLRRRRITIELRTAVVIENLPPLVLIAKPGELQPIDPADGTVICQLAWTRLGPDQPLRRDVDLPALRTPLYLRAFFAGPQPSGRYRLIDPPCGQLKVR